MAGGEQAFTHALCRKACLQIIYAQAERRWASNSQKAAASPSKTGRQQKPPTPPSSVFVVEQVTDALADVVATFIHQIARSSAARAGLSGRSNANLIDVISALDALSSSTQSTIRDIARYATFQKIDFPIPLPEFPILPSTLVKKRSMVTSIDIPTDDAHTKRARSHIEQWMPPIPSAHTFVSTPGYLAPTKRPPYASGPEQRRSVEMSLAKLRDAGRPADATSQLHSQMASASPSLGNNPFIRLPKMATSMVSAPEAGQPVDNMDEREPLEPEDNLVDSNAGVIDFPKSNISDQKRARVDRILSESGTIMVSSTAATPANAADASPVPTTPVGDIPVASPKNGGAL